MTVAEKIKGMREKIAASQERIDKEQKKIDAYRHEIETLESLEIKSMLKEIDLPLDQVKELLKKLKLTAIPDPNKQTDNDKKAR